MLAKRRTRNAPSLPLTDISLNFWLFSCERKKFIILLNADVKLKLCRFIPMLIKFLTYYLLNVKFNLTLLGFVLSCYTLFMDSLQELLFIPSIFLIYCLPLILGLFAVWIVRLIIPKYSYSRDFISGLIMLCATREFLKNFRFRRDGKKH